MCVEDWNTQIAELFDITAIILLSLTHFGLLLSQVYYMSIVG